MFRMEKQEKPKARFTLAGLSTFGLGCGYMVLSTLTAILSVNYWPQHDTDIKCFGLEFMSCVWVLWSLALIISGALGWSLAFSSKSISKNVEKLYKYLSVFGHLILIRVVHAVTQLPNESYNGCMRYWIAVGDTVFHIIFYLGFAFLAFRVKKEKERAAAAAAAVPNNNLLMKELP